MSILETVEKNKAKLSYVGLRVIECFEDARLGANYINEKISDFAGLTSYESLHQALKILDEKNVARLAEKLGVTVADLNTTLSILNKI